MKSNLFLVNQMNILLVTITQVELSFIALVWHKKKVIANSLPYNTVKNALQEIEQSLDNIPSVEFIVILKREKIACYVYQMYNGKPISAKLYKGRISLVLSTDKEKKILDACLKVPHGKVISYGELTKMGGIKRGSRFAGNVMSKNFLPILIPCHRIIRSNGSLGNYGGGSGGTDIKRKLIQREKMFYFKKYTMN